MKKLLELSLQSIIGFISKKSLKVWGTILGKKVIVLIDNGASTNFISRSVDEALKLKQTKTTRFVVEVGTGQRVKSMGSCKQPGDLVYLRSQPYKLCKFAKKVNEKLSPRFYGSYSVLSRIGEVPYHLDLPPYSRMHLVFHVSWLKGVVKDSTPVQHLSPFLSEDLEMQVQPESVVDYMTLVDGSSEVLIRWKDLPDFENTWESYEVISAQFPNFPLEDKVKFVGAGIIRPAIPKVYVCRSKAD
ncbi:hypothetical protein V6N11_018134 [Hibiscus sabdariffa]|uniref:Chromo domain-containing protein n=1 Tax=Hibiscus sabdariffa TaxID=183260 RepID=A0ABR2T710_9ROSI